MYRIWTTFRHTLRHYRGAVLGWGLGIAFLGLILIPFYDVFTEQQSDFMQMIEAYPPEFLAFFGGDANSLLTPEGFLGMYGFSMLPVIVPIFAVIAGSGLFAADEERGRLDLVMSHPVGRTPFFFGRYLAFTGAVTGILFISWLGFALPLLATSMEITMIEMGLPFLQLWVQVLLYGSLGLLLSTVLPSRNLAATVTGLVMVVSYLVSSLTFMSDVLAAIAKVMPYAYYQGSGAIRDFNEIWFFALLAVSLGMTLLAWWRFERRDIRLSGEGSFNLKRFSMLARKHA